MMKSLNITNELNNQLTTNKGNIVDTCPQCGFSETSTNKKFGLAMNKYTNKDKSKTVVLNSIEPKVKLGSDEWTLIGLAGAEKAEAKVVETMPNQVKVPTAVAAPTVVSKTSEPTKTQQP